MTTITTDKQHDRLVALTLLTRGTGLTPSTYTATPDQPEPIDEHLQALFGLESSDPAAFAAKLSLVRDYVEDTPDLKAAYYMLGIDETGTPEQRFNTLMFDVHQTTSWNHVDIQMMESSAVRGLSVIATMYDAMVMFENLAAAARTTMHEPTTSARSRQRLMDALPEKIARS